MRAMLDAHPEVRCGQETRVIPRISSNEFQVNAITHFCAVVQFYANWIKSEKESMRLEEAGVSKKVLAIAVSQFCLEIIAHHGYSAPRL